MKKLSLNLKPIYELELKKGNKVLRVEEPSGSKCPFAIVFRYPLHFKDIEREIQVTDLLERWENTDTHYPLEAGYACRDTRHTISGPISGEFPVTGELS